MSSTETTLKKAKIIPLDQNGNRKQAIDVLFNPEQYSMKKGNQFAAIAIPGRQNPIIQFIKGEAETLTLDLFFDTHTSWNNVDVRKEYTDKISDLLHIDADIHAPPVCVFEWGGHSFTGIIENIDKKFTMFDKEGKPLRATLGISFKEYTNQEGKRKSSDFTKRRTIREGDSLWLIASKEYGDPDKWKLIAEANNIENPLTIRSGTQIILPKL